MGKAADIHVPGGHDGEGRADIAVWLHSEGNFYIIQSSTGTVNL